MFFNFKSDKNKIAKLLSSDPKALKKFEEAYSKVPMGDMPANAKQAASTNPSEDLSSLEERIVNELINETRVYNYTRNKGSSEIVLSSKELAERVSLDEIMALPVDQRPELSGDLIKKDINENAYEILLTTYGDMLKTKDPKKKKRLYDTFRQGLDILDIDPVVYRMLDLNKNTMGYWLPKITTAVDAEGFFKVPNTTIAKVPMTLLQLTRLEYSEHTQTTLNIVDAWARKAFKLDPAQKYFIKTGTYSSKFDFRNAKITDPEEVKQIGEYLLYIHSSAIQMAQIDLRGRRPSMYGVSTTNEWVVREFIENEDNHNFEIYHGLPLHTEYRVFVDFDTKEVLGITSYWDPDTMKKHFDSRQDVDAAHDYVTYTAHEPELTAKYNKFKDTVTENVAKLLQYDTGLSGQWSIDIMQNGDSFWLIDMAVAENSAFYSTCVPENKRHRMEENWIPKLTAGE